MNPMGSEKYPPQKAAKPAGTREGKGKTLHGRGILLYYVSMDLPKVRRGGAAGIRRDANGRMTR
jgi:hypothetical protein